MPIGTFINIAAVLAGGGVGLIFHEILTKNIKTIVFQGLGLSTLVIGMQMALKHEDLVVLIFSILIGGIWGEALKLDKKAESMSDALKKKLKVKDGKFTEGLVTAFLIFCVGSLTILGALTEGISGDKSLLLTKSVLDGFTAIALASTFGMGVLFSVIPMLVFQGGLTLFAAQFQSFFSDILLAQLTAVGGVMILGIGLNLLDIKKVKVINFLPSLVVVVLLTLLYL